MLPRYTVRESARAKHVSLKISVEGELEVVIPPGFDQKRIPEIVQRKQGWIERVTHRIESQQARMQPENSEALPQQVSFAAIDEIWQVDYCQTAMPGVRVVEQAKKKQLGLYGAIDQSDLCLTALRQWVAHKARLHLVPRLKKISREINLPFQQASIRQQKTLWGSCSGKKNISLNSKLMFLPPDLVRYVCVHELCHTIHMNHSSEFWALVRRHERNYEQLDASLRDARYWVPLWMERKEK